MSIFKKIHDLKVAEYRQQYKWYAHADPEIRDKIIVRNFHMTKRQYEAFCNFMHSKEVEYGKAVLFDMLRFIYPFNRINKIGGK